MAERHYRRRNFLINRKFQFKFSLYVCSWIFALSLMYPLLIQSVFDFFLKYMALDPMGPVLASIQDVRHKVILLLVALQIFFVGITFLISIFMSHRIAGPIYKLKMFMAAASRGDIQSKLSFRQHDHFREIATEFNSMISSFRGIFVSHEQTAREVTQKLERLLESSQDEKAKKDLKTAIEMLHGIRTPSMDAEAVDSPSV